MVKEMVSRAWRGLIHLFLLITAGLGLVWMLLPYLGRGLHQLWQHGAPLARRVAPPLGRVAVAAGRLMGRFSWSVASLGLGGLHQLSQQPVDWDEVRSDLTMLVVPLLVVVPYRKLEVSPPVFVVLR